MTDMTPQQLAQALGGAKYIGGGEWQALCPCHDDHDPSLAITTAENGKLLFTCCGGNGCSQDAVLAELRRRGLWSNRDRSDDGSYIVYDYVDEYGALLFQVCKAPATPTKPKRFWQRQPDGQGGWKRKLDPKTGKMKLTMEGARLVPYHLDRIVAAKQNANGQPPRVYICEGEKDADNVTTAGLLATTSPRGASKGKPKWRPEYNRVFAGFDVVILLDNDEAGRSHAEHVAANLSPGAAAVRILALPGLPKKGDVTDWIHAGGTPETLAALVDEISPMPARSPPPDSRPHITVVPGERHLAADAGLASLKAAATPFYQRGDRLVRIARLKARAADKSEIRVPGIAVVTMPTLERALGSAATWETCKYGKYRPDDPPGAVAEQIMGMTDEWHFPPLTGIVACPTLRPDGSLLNIDGYDASTGLVLYSTIKIPPIKDKPSKEQAADALMLLDKLLDEFPFATDNISKSVALSMLMTPVLRGAMEAAPMHLFIAPQSGTGKSYIADLASLIATGERAAAFAVSVNPEETEKRLNGHALAGFPVILMDNCGEMIDRDPTLCQIIERPRLSVRRLGISEPVTIDNTFTIFANGNNTSVVDDLVRRTLRGTLDANMEDPESRQFTLNPARMIANDRGKYVAAIITIARAFIACQGPQLPPLPSFDGWSNFVRSPLVWLGHADPVKSIEQLRNADPVRSERAIVFEAWGDEIGKGRGFTARRLVEMANETSSGGSNFSYAHPEFRDALLQIAVKFGTNHVIEPRRLGKWLTKHENTVAAGLKLIANRHDPQRPLYSLEPRSK